MGPAEAPDWLSWLQQSALAGAMRESGWLYPAAEILHIVAFVVALGCLLVLDFRLIGLGRRIAFDQVAGALLPWAIGAFCLTIPPAFGSCSRRRAALRTTRPSPPSWR
jgi:hypothetical protein